MLPEKRDMDAAKKFLTTAKYVAGRKPVRVTTDAHNSYPRAIRRILGRKVVHRTCRYLNNRVEQDHRSIKQRYYSRKVYAISGFGSFGAASRFCHAYMEVGAIYGGNTSATERRQMKRYPYLSSGGCFRRDWLPCNSC
jgi:putative transposase